MLDTSIPFVQFHPGRACHTGAFFCTRDEEYRVLLPFITEGIECGEKALHIVDPARHEDHLHRLRSPGIDTAAAEVRKQLEIREWQDTGLIKGRFEQDRIIRSEERRVGKEGRS